MELNSFPLDSDGFLFQRGGPRHSDGLSAARNQLGNIHTHFCPAWKQDCRAGERRTSSCPAGNVHHNCLFKFFCPLQVSLRFQDLMKLFYSAFQNSSS